MKFLERYFAEAADQPAAYTEETIRSMLTRHDAVTAVQMASRWRRILRSRGFVTLMAAAATSAVFFLAFGDQSDSPKQIAAHEAVTPGKPAVVPPVGAPVAAPVSFRKANEPSSLHPAPSSNLQGADQPIAATVEPSVDIAGVRMIELTDPELERIGVTMLPNGEIAFGYAYAELPDCLPTNAAVSDSTMLRCVRRDSILITSVGQEQADLGRVTMYPASMMRRNLVVNSWEMVTDDVGTIISETVNTAELDPGVLSGLDRRFSGHDAGIEYRRLVDSVRGMDRARRELQVNTLLPIRVRLGSRAPESLQTPQRTHVVFWCRPDVRLLAEFPARVRTNLLRELVVASRETSQVDTIARERRAWARMMTGVLDSLSHVLNQSARTRSDAAREISGETTYMTIAQASNGAILGTSILPRPSRRSATLICTLGESRMVGVRLHDIHGRLIRKLRGSQLEHAGSSMIELNLEETPPGMYLVSVLTDFGEQVLQRLIVE